MYFEFGLNTQMELVDFITTLSYCSKYIFSLYLNLTINFIRIIYFIQVFFLHLTQFFIQMLIHLLSSIYKEFFILYMSSIKGAIILSMKTMMKGYPHSDLNCINFLKDKYIDQNPPISLTYFTIIYYDSYAQTRMVIIQSNLLSKIQC
jgi:hypothetical protein